MCQGRPKYVWGCSSRNWAQLLFHKDEVRGPRRECTSFSGKVPDHKTGTYLVPRVHSQAHVIIPSLVCNLVIVLEQKRMNTSTRQLKSHATQTRPQNQRKSSPRVLVRHQPPAKRVTEYRSIFLPTYSHNHTRRCFGYSSLSPFSIITPDNTTRKNVDTGRMCVVAQYAIAGLRSSKYGKNHILHTGLSMASAIIETRKKNNRAPLINTYSPFHSFKCFANPVRIAFTTFRRFHNLSLPNKFHLQGGFH